LFTRYIQTWNPKVFAITDFEFKITKFKIVNPKWQAQIQNVLEFL